MTSRYGRNKRKADRAKIAELTSQLQTCKETQALLEDEYKIVCSKIDSAYETAFNDYVNRHGLLKQYTDRMGDALGRGLSEELRPIAQQIIHAQQNENSIDLKMRSSTAHKERVLEGCIKKLSYSFVFPPVELKNIS